MQKTMTKMQSRTVKRIFAAKAACPQTDTSVLEAQIDGMVYQLYGPSAEEVRVLEGRK
ncbi:hypothetical protein FACS1894190_10730 [Spirochaetia bacterium]|nr:hypothetical protein FACS1894190_10730 [Spirochaetia bacterium]